jgi:hypothetical protein
MANKAKTQYASRPRTTVIRWRPVGESRGGASGCFGCPESLQELDRQCYLDGSPRQGQECSRQDPSTSVVVGAIEHDKKSRDSKWRCRQRRVPEFPEWVRCATRHRIIAASVLPAPPVATQGLEPKREPRDNEENGDDYEHDNHTKAVPVTAVPTPICAIRSDRGYSPPQQ